LLDEINTLLTRIEAAHGVRLFYPFKNSAFQDAPERENVKRLLVRIRDAF
jgi:hypothetical protein